MSGEGDSNASSTSFNVSAAEWNPGAPAWTPPSTTFAEAPTTMPAADSVKEEAIEPEAAAAEPSQTAVEAEAETNVPNEEEEEENESDTISELRAMLEAGEISKDDFDEALAELKGEVAPTPAEEVEKPSSTEEAVKKETATSGESGAKAAPTQAKTKPKSKHTSKAPPPDEREHLNVVFIGHVDAGKSTISGSMLFLTGQVDERTIEKFEKEAKERNRDSWFMAFIMDTNEEERAKGKTVEVGMAHFSTDTKRITILDAPGHKNYVPNMIGGAAQADVGVLVISSRKGEFEAGFEKDGQTREHALLARTLGVEKLIVLVNKMDTHDWSEKRFTEIKKKLQPFLRSCGYKVKRDVAWVAAAGLKGENLVERIPVEKAPWLPEKQRKSLLEALDDVTIAGRDAEGPLRLPILEKFADRGTWVMGKVEQGTLSEGDTVLVMPNRESSRVEELQINDHVVAYAKPGENVRVKLRNVALESVAKGFVLSSIENPIPIVKQFTARINVLGLLEHRPILTAGYNCVLHVHTVIEECKIKSLVSGIGKDGKPNGVKPSFVKSKGSAIVKIKIRSKVCAEMYEKMRQLGRFTLRDEGTTIAIGIILGN